MHFGSQADLDIPLLVDTQKIFPGPFLDLSFRLEWLRAGEARVDLIASSIQKSSVDEADLVSIQKSSVDEADLV